MEEKQAKRPKKPRGRFRYQPVYAQLWHDSTFKALSHFSRELFLYILTGPQANMIGLYVLQPGTAIEDMNCLYEPVPQCYLTAWMDDSETPFGTPSITPLPTPLGSPLPTPSAGLWEGLAELTRAGFIEYDPEVKVVWIKNFLEYNFFSSTNNAKGAAAVLREVSGTVLIDRFLDAADACEWECACEIRGLYLNHWPNGKKPLTKPLTKGVPKEVGNPGTGTGAGTGTGTATASAETKKLTPQELALQDPPDWDPSVAYEC